MKPVELKKGVYWVGAVDWDIRDFHGYSTYKGTSYNSYLVVDDHVTLFDTVKKGFTSDLMHRIHNIIDPKRIDYLVVNHLEMDHSGSLPEVIAAIEPEKVFCSPMGHKNILAHFHGQEWPLQIVKTGETLNLGQRNVHFLETRMVHWPDSMFSYLAEDKILISSDGFGLHWATSERFDDEVDQSELMAHAAKYYANILLLYGPLIQKLLAQVKQMNIPIDMIAPDHGVIWRGDPGKIVAAYDRWSRQEATNKALVVYNTMWHSTELMAKAVYDGLLDEGCSVKLMNLANSHRSDIITELLDAKALVVGSSTLNNGMLPLMADLLTYMRGLKPTGKLAAAFGSFGWSGEAVKHMSVASWGGRWARLPRRHWPARRLPPSLSLKTQVRRLLRSPDLVFDSPALDQALEGLPLKAVARALLGALASPREDERWRAVALIGRAVAGLATDHPEAGREIVRRLLWSLNEESGAMGWGAAEALAEIMTQHETLGREYVGMFLCHLEPGPKYLDHPGLAAGALWGLGRLLRERPRLLAGRDISSLLRPFVDSDDATLRALANQALLLSPGVTHRA
jgi:flavorubredoxin